jgi:hypothetical protein
MVYETVQPVGGRKYPGPEERGLVTIIGKSVTFRGQTYAVAKNLDPRNYEEFISPQRAKLRP